MKDKKNIVKIVIVLAVVVLAVIGGIFLFRGEKAIADVETTIDQKVWLEAGKTLGVRDGDNVIVLTVDSDLNFDKAAESYKYELTYKLNVNGTDYNGNHTFSKGYSMHSEDNEMPYRVAISDFEMGKLEVAIKNK